MIADTSTELPETPPNTLSTPSSARAWLVCTVAALFFFYEFVEMNMFNALNQTLRTAFNIDATTVGYLSSAYFLADVIFLIPAGLLLDRFSTKRVIVIAMIGTILGTTLFAQTDQLWVAGICRFVTGIGNAFCFLSCIRLASRWFPPQKMALVTGVIVTIAMLGGYMAQAPLVLAIKAIGWRSALLCVAALGVVILALISYFVEDCPPEKRAEQQQQQQASRNAALLSCLVTAGKNRQNWLAGLYTSLLNLAIFILGGLWGIPYLEKVRGFSTFEAASIAGMIFFGTIFGSPLFGYLSDKWLKRKQPMMLGAIASTVTVLVVMYTSNLSYFSCSALFFLLGFFTSSQVISYPLVNESNDNQLSSTALSITSVLVMGGGLVFDPLFGWFMDVSHTGPVTASGYTINDYQHAFIILPIAFIVSLVLSLCIRETHCQPVRSDSTCNPQ